MTAADPVSPLVLSLPAAAAVVLLLVHAVRYRGAGPTALLVGLVLAWYLPKEYAIQQQVLAWHVYVFDEGFLRVAGIPIAVPVGYVFTSYVSWTVAERVTDRLPGCRGYLLPTILVWLLTTSAIGYAMEVTGVAAGWWSWKYDGVAWAARDEAERVRENFGLVHTMIPILPVGGWAIYMFPLATLYLAFQFTPLRERRWKPAYYLLYFTLYFGLCLRGLASFLLILAALPFTLTSRVRAETPRRELGDERGFGAALVRHAPLVALAAMLSTSAYVEIVRRGRPDLLISWVPLVTLVAIGWAGRSVAVPIGVLGAGLTAAWLVGSKLFLLPWGFLVLLCAVAACRVLLAGVPSAGVPNEGAPVGAAARFELPPGAGLAALVLAAALAAHVLPWEGAEGATDGALVSGLTTGPGLLAAAALGTALLLVRSLRDPEVHATGGDVVRRGLVVLSLTAVLCDVAYLLRADRIGLAGLACALSLGALVCVERLRGARPVANLT